LSGVARKVVQAIEHQTIELEFADLFSGQTLDFYSETAKLFQVTFRKGRPCIQLGKFLGLIPINDRLAVEVTARVSIKNLERIVAFAEGYEPLVLSQHQRQYQKTVDRPASLLESITVQFLGAVEKIVHEGLWLEYRSKRHVGAYPVGRVAPFESFWRSRKSGVPIGVSNAFIRSPATDANNWILAALRKLHSSVDTTIWGSAKMSSRIASCRRTFQPCAVSGFDAFDFRRLEMTVEAIPEGRMLYLNALRLALLILGDMGIDIRERGGKTTLGSILVDMETVFEVYVREVLRRQLRSKPEVQVLDGNKAGATGAKKAFFSGTPVGGKNPDMTPDIVVRRYGAVRLILDAKYKPLPDMPDRPDLNQLATYAASYGSPRAALLYPDRAQGQPHIARLGDIGGFELLVARFDLSAPDIEAEERKFAEAIVALL
jgi:5-methylcytosine-specific restriction enzyme subunit McrC